MGKKRPVVERFWASVDRNGPVPAHKPELGPCWLWTASRHDNGYGQIKRHRKTLTVHRFSWEYHRGPVPEGLFVLHHCDVRHCVNPDHLFVGTQVENMQDCLEKGRYNNPKGPDVYNAKFGEDGIRLLFQLRAEGRTHRYLADFFGTNQSTISRILARKRYRLVEV